jgi:hypothetical protein
LNLYGYAGGDPINYADPFGLCVPFPACLEHAVAQLESKFKETAAAVFGTASASVTVGGVTASKSPGAAVSYSASTNITEVGGGVSFTWGHNVLEPGTAPGYSVSVGLGKHLGVTLSEDSFSVNIGASTGLPVSVATEVTGAKPIPRPIAPIRADATAVNVKPVAPRKLFP